MRERDVAGDVGPSQCDMDVIVMCVLCDECRDDDVCAMIVCVIDERACAGWEGRYVSCVRCMWCRAATLAVWWPTVILYYTR